ncbi:MAG: GWxTD domain-containing protein [Acidobacteria bacterium]|nr:GWxTD domain-containing protein [Acidobacteriota bacterium]
MLSRLLTPSESRLKIGWLQWALLLFVAFGFAVAQPQKEKQKEETEKDYFKKWQEEDVVYIISPEEKDIFKKLQTDEERENFIEQFWFRRDPTQETRYNEAKEEHYRRIQYSNEHFASGIPGWKTDRGMTYIRMGPPDRIEAHPSGGNYDRPSWEGGGSTSTYPFERWEYRHIDGVGDDVEIEFVDDTLTGEYRMTMNPDDKDALLRVPGAGLTDAEALGLANRVDRIVRKTSPMPWTNPLLIGYGRSKDQPFEKLQTFTNLQRPPAIKFRDLRRPEELVSASISYQILPFELRVDYLPVNESYMVPISIVVPNKSLQYLNKDQANRAVVGVYGRVTSLTGQVVTVFEETIVSEIDSTGLVDNQKLKSIYQKSLQLPPGRYKLDMILRDENSGKIGTLSTGIILPKATTDTLTISSVVLADRIALQADQTGAFGAAKVFPNVSAMFRPDQAMYVFFQLSNFTMDAARSAPFLTSEVKIMRGSQEVLREEIKVDSSNAQNRDRLELVHELNLRGMDTGKYELSLHVQDQISGQQLERHISFQISNP